MKGRLFNLASILSAVLSLAAGAMQVRSGYVTDSWELPPRRAPNYDAASKSGWVTHRHVESTAGRLTWVRYDVMEEGRTPPVYYHAPSEPLAPGQRGRDDWRYHNHLPTGTVHRHFPFVAEWYLMPRGGRYVAVPWLTLFLTFALPPVARGLWTKRRPRASSGPAFSVVPLSRPPGGPAGPVASAESPPPAATFHL